MYKDLENIDLENIMCTYIHLSEAQGIKSEVTLSTYRMRAHVHIG
jgi:hypothetical protein